MMLKEKGLTLPGINPDEKEETVSPDSIIKYIEHDGAEKTLIVASIFDGDDPIEETKRLERESLKCNSFLSEDERKIVEFYPFRPDHYIAESLLGHKKGDVFDLTFSVGMVVSYEIVDFFPSETS